MKEKEIKPFNLGLTIYCHIIFFYYLLCFNINDFISSFPKFPLATPSPIYIKSLCKGLIKILFLPHKVSKTIQPAPLFPSLNP